MIGNWNKIVICGFQTWGIHLNLYLFSSFLHLSLSKLPLDRWFPPEVEFQLTCHQIVSFIRIVKQHTLWAFCLPEQNACQFIVVIGTPRPDNQIAQDSDLCSKIAILQQRLTSSFSVLSDTSGFFCMFAASPAWFSFFQQWLFYCQSTIKARFICNDSNLLFSLRVTMDLFIASLIDSLIVSLDRHTYEYIIAFV